ncbi:MAG: hypothetical protein ABWZ25_12510 [Chitinophagaceae bacterium]
MSNNIIETLQVNLGLPALQKVDPNIQEAKDVNHSTPAGKLAQAAIPTVVAGIYKLSRTEKGCAGINAANSPSSWLQVVFNDKTANVVEKVAHYSNVPREHAESQMEKMAEEAIRVIGLRQSGTGTSVTAIRDYMSQQRHNILVYLPAAMQIGDLLNDNSMDDRTNKMEGPISNLMHKIENALARGGS